MRPLRGALMRPAESESDPRLVCTGLRAGFRSCLFIGALMTYILAQREVVLAPRQNVPM